MTDVYAEQIAELVPKLGFGKPSFGPINSTEVARCLSKETIEKWDTNRRLRVGTRFNPVSCLPGQHYDFDDPWTMHGLLSIVARFPEKAYALNSAADWKDRLPAKFSDYRGCDVRLSGRCSNVSLDMMPLKSGEFVTVHKICPNCLRWFYAHDAQLVDTYADSLLEDLSVEPTNSKRFAQLKRYNRYPDEGPDLKAVSD